MRNYSIWNDIDRIGPISNRAAGHFDSIRSRSIQTRTILVQFDSSLTGGIAWVRPALRESPDIARHRPKRQVRFGPMLRGKCDFRVGHLAFRELGGITYRRCNGAKAGVRPALGESSQIAQRSDSGHVKRALALSGGGICFFGDLLRCCAFLLKFPRGGTKGRGVARSYETPNIAEKAELVPSDPSETGKCKVRMGTLAFVRCLASP